MMDSNTCKACPIGWWPNEELTGIVPSHKTYIAWKTKTFIIIKNIGFL